MSFSPIVTPSGACPNCGAYGGSDCSFACRRADQSRSVGPFVQRDGTLGVIRRGHFRSQDGRTSSAVRVALAHGLIRA